MLEGALGLNGLHFAYTGSEVRDSYTNNVYDMVPNSGNKFYVMKFNVSNTSAADVDANILAMNPKFKATLNGAASADNDLTLVPEDLATFKGVIRAGESRELIILFQFGSGDLTNIQSTSLKCTVKGSTSDIAL